MGLLCASAIRSLTKLARRRQRTDHDHCKKQRSESAADTGDAPEPDVVPQRGATQRGARGGQGIDRRDFGRIRDALPKRRARRGFLGREIEFRKPSPPRADGLSKRLVGCDAPFGGGVLRIVQQAHHVIAGHGVIGVVRVHPMHSCNAKRLRRTQLLTVPSGTLSLPANSPWLMP